MSMGPENPTTAAPVDPFPIAADEIEASATKEECIWRIIRVKPQPWASFSRVQDLRACAQRGDRTRFHQLARSRGNCESIQAPGP